jgi:uncharacterized protein YybS (DUF2232 family)
MGQLGPFSQFIVPGLLVWAAEGLSIGLASSIIAGAFVLGTSLLLWGGLPEALLWFSQSTGLAVVFLLARRHSWTGMITLLVGFVYLCTTFVVALGLGTGGNPMLAYDQMEQEIGRDLDQSFALYKEAYPAAPEEDVAVWFELVKASVIRFLPGIMGLVFLTTGLTNILVARRVSARGTEVFGPEFSLWRLPDHLVWVPIAAGALALAGDGPYRTGAENALLVLGGVYFLQGLAVTAFYFRRFKIPVFVRWLIYVLLGIQWYGLLAVVLVGLSDVWFDLRSRVPPAQEAQ